MTPEEVAGLRAGEGMGYALPAELNGYPGPKHVLELADDLRLNQSQRDATAALRSIMLERAKSAGVQLIGAYQALDASFRAGNVSEETLRKHTERIGHLEGNLRAIHMEAHLRMMSILSHEQVRAYSELRGYAAEHGHEHGT